MDAPVFESAEAYRRSVGDSAFWTPMLRKILARHGLPDRSSAPVAGVGGTFPTFLVDDLAIKLYGHYPTWAESVAAERAVHAALGDDPAIGAPGVLAEGRLFEDEVAPWPYLVTRRMPGRAWNDGIEDTADRPAVARDLGRRIGRLHRLPPGGAVTRDHWRPVPMADAVAASSLPPHLHGQIDGFLARFPDSDPVLVHGDLTGRHVFVQNGTLAGIIDWGDAMVIDRHYELAKLHLDLFDGGKALLRAFLEGADWPVGPDFAQRALAMALHRQAIGLAQHPDAMDVFHKLPSIAAVAQIDSLDDLATALFDVR